MKKRALTLLEVMIVIFLITLITGTIGYSMKGSLEKGRAFRTEQGREQLNDLLLMALANGEKSEDIVRDPVGALKKVGLAKDPDKLVCDGWNEKFEITANAAKNGFHIYSKSYDLYENRMNRRRTEPAAAVDDEQ